MTTDAQPVPVESATPRPTRRWYQFSLQGLLVAVTLLCVGPLAYVAYEREQCRQGGHAFSEIYKLGGRVSYRHDQPTARPDWLKLVLGDDVFRNVQSLEVADPMFTDDLLAHLKSLPNLQVLGLARTRVTNAGLAHLASATNLNRLYICDSPQISDAGLAHIVPLAKLEFLNLSGTRLTDAGLPQLAKLPRLKELWLRKTDITDAGLMQLSSLPQLQALRLNETAITEAGAARLQKALPNCRIEL